ncbi:MAG TPA: hypothetical protein VKD43_10040 [Xanthobacteraceae bacterium]|nr:hypothetical protein [Xanthobacteraceae bacterium]
MLRKITLAALALVFLVGGAHAETAVPDSLVIGYDHEGKIDASPQACLAHVKEITAWDKAMTDKGAKDVCAARKRHVEAYAALQANYKSFVKAFSVDRRLDLPSAVSNLKVLIKACIDHKFGLTTGGHNIRIDIIENEIAAECLVLGSNLIKGETAKYKALR